jgi:hypothetical protein
LDFSAVQLDMVFEQRGRAFDLRDLLGGRLGEPGRIQCRRLGPVGGEVEHDLDRLGAYPL